MANVSTSSNYNNLLDSIFSTDEELNKIKSLNLPETKQYLERVRDVLIFYCYVGLRYSDVANLRRSDVKDNQIEVTT